MANCPSTKKRARQTPGRTERNKHYKSMVRNLRKKLNDQVVSGNKEAGETFKKFASLVHRVAGKGIIHKNRARSLEVSMATKLSKL